jgi:hypothetical protein
MVVGSVKKIANAVFFGNNTTKAAHIRLLDRKGFSTHKNRNLAPSAKSKPQKNISKAKTRAIFCPQLAPYRHYFLLTKMRALHIP